MLVKMVPTLTVYTPIDPHNVTTYSQITDSEEQKKLFADVPEEYLKYRKLVEGELNQRFKFVRLYSVEMDDRILTNLPQIINGSAEQEEALAVLLPPVCKSS